jgi:hypothetical protein
MSMETAVSFKSSIAELYCYQRTRFPLVRFVPLALFLALAASALDKTPPLGLWLLRSFLVLPWLLQFRLADDLADLPRDRRDHPDRVLVRVALAPFVWLMVLLTVGNTLLAVLALSSPRWMEFLTLTWLLLIWYAVTYRYRPPLLLASLPMLLKYPALVYLLSDSAEETSLPMCGVLVLVYACFLAYECLHDTRLRTTAGTILLALALLAMTAAALLPVFAQPTDWLPICWLAPGCVVLAWLFCRHCRRVDPGVWSQGVFLVGCFWIVFAYLVPALQSRE